LYSEENICQTFTVHNGMNWPTFEYLWPRKKCGIRKPN